MVGRPGEIRTPDPRFRKPLLYPSELQAHEQNHNTNYCLSAYRPLRFGEQSWFETGQFSRVLHLLTSYDNDSEEGGIVKRRDFIKRVTGAAAVPLGGMLAEGNILGANDRVNVGLIGCGGRGQYVAGLMRQLPNVEFVAVADVHIGRANEAKGWFAPGCRAFQDFRKLLEQRDVDAVLVATPDHWHAIATILACEAQKDVYVEKPLAYSIKEGRAMVNAARRHQRVVQAGMQHRSAAHFREVARIIQSGEIGPVHFVRVWNYLNMSPDGIGRAADSAPPDGLDWDFYLGPAPAVPYNQNRYAVTYRWFWDYAGGMATDYGTHRFDTVHQVMGVDAPLAIAGWGRRFELKDGGDTPDTLQITYEFPGFILSYEASMLNGHGLGGRTPGMNYYLTRGPNDRPHGMAFYGTNGTLYADRVSFEIYPEPKGESGPGALRLHSGSATWNSSGKPAEGFRMERRSAEEEDATALHARNFIECVRSRQNPVGDVETAHRSAIVPHLGNIAIRTGHKLRWDSAKEEIVDDPAASAYLSRKARPPWNEILKS
jgi:predicted dehydrogenase